MATFQCNASGCPNEGVIYDFGDDAPATAECGGCKAKLVAQND